MLITTMTRDQIALPIATITRAQAIEGGWLVTDAQGEEHRVDNVEWNIAVEGTPSAMIPALPGTYVINRGTDDDGKPKAWKTNVLGWMIAADTEVRPVTTDPNLSGEKNWDVLHPDGRVERNDGSSWDSLDDWLLSEAKFEQAA
jgi:hypothetical protein